MADNAHIVAMVLAPMRCSVVVRGAALAVTVGLHVWRRNALLSIVGGTLTNSCWCRCSER